MPADNTRLIGLQNNIHQHLSFVMNVRDGIAARDGAQTRATAMATLSAAQNAADELVAVLESVRAEVRRAFPAPPATRLTPPAPVLRSPDAAFSGFTSPAGA